MDYSLVNCLFRFPADTPEFTGRRVDLFVKSIPSHTTGSYHGSVREYLKARRTKTARCLAAKAVVVLAPLEDVGSVIWQME